MKNAIRRDDAIVDDVATTKKYVVLVTQASTDAPTVVVLKNTLGGTPVWGYTSEGIYTCTLADAFTAAKTTITLTPRLATGNIGVAHTSKDVITITSMLEDGTSGVPGITGGNGKISDCTFDVTVYV